MLDPQTEKVARFSDFDLSCHGGVGTKGIFPFKGKNMDQPNLLMVTIYEAAKGQFRHFSEIIE